MALYGDLDTVERLLRATPNSSLNADADIRLAAIQAAVSAYIEEQTGRTFGVAAVAESVVVKAAEVFTIDGRGGASAVLLLPKAIRAITSVVSNPEWSGSGWTDGETVDPTAYRPIMLTNTGEAMALEAVGGGYWLGRYVITGTFEDADSDTVVPADVTYIANWLIAEQFKYEQSSAAGIAGPDGQTLQLKNPYKHALVCTIIAKYRTSENIVV